MKMWKKIVALMLGIMLMGTVAGAFAEDLVATAPILDEVLEEFSVDEETDVKARIMQSLKDKLAHTGDALMGMDLDVDINLVMMGEATPIKVKAEVNAISSGLEAIQIFGTLEMVAKDDTESTPLDGYLMKNEDNSYTMYLRAEEGWTKQSIDLGEMMDSITEATQTIDENGAFVIVNEPEQKEDGLHFQAYLDLAKLLASTGEEGMNELNEATSEMVPGVDVAEMLSGMAPVSIQIVCNDNYDPTAISIDAKNAIQTLADVVINGIVNQMLASMAEASAEEAAGAEEMDMSQFMSLTVNTLTWNLKDIQTLPANSVVIELPEEAKNAVDAQLVNMGGAEISDGEGF